MTNLIKASLLIIVSLLVGCQQEKQDLASYVASVKAQQRPDIEPMPVMKAYEKFSYSASDLRSPFVKTVVEAPTDEQTTPIVDNGIHPDKNRLKEALESYSLSELQFVGTLGRDVSWALIRASDGVIHRVKVGNYMGQNHGQILSVTESELTLKEIVSDGRGAYIERESSLTIADVN
ncbi:MAG: pilus assembly protein PilP [Gammaproteobacteria bacterium]|nr:pilus assembly protein PilP [Gammaproteobacteria bacterium]